MISPRRYFLISILHKRTPHTNTPNILLKTPVESSMNVSGLHIDQYFHMPPPSFINIPGITVSSITNPTVTWFGNEYPPHPCSYFLNTSSTPSDDQTSRSNSSPENKPMVNIPPLTERSGFISSRNIVNF
ncbi:hypothetical protein O181_025619 [Austropuccinia psidii MF-1]|uniref:Uncharacterized protein n=1 Tax=Austropuccinia psidii MF-1 TaxID=1389203 RepID=A0A9Q3H0U2_9BASI|nr:hypothetical protein [Austropuccinia psidii MF-1]